MKKIVLLLVFATYLLLNLGISMRIHYCGNAVRFIDFFPVTPRTCCAGNKKPSCCKDKMAHINPETIQDNTPLVHVSFPDYAKFNLVLHDFSFLSGLESEKTSPYSTRHLFEKIPLKAPLYLRNKALLL